MDTHMGSKELQKAGWLRIAQTRKHPSAGMWLVQSCSWLEPRSSNSEFSVSAVLRLWRTFSISYQLLWHADTLLRFFREDVSVHYQECVKTACVSECILHNGRKVSITTVPFLGQTLCCHVFNLHVFGAFICPSHMALQQGPSYCQFSCHDNRMHRSLRDSTVSNNMSQKFLIVWHPETCSKSLCVHARTYTHTRYKCLLLDLVSWYLLDKIWPVDRLEAQQRTGNRKTDSKKWQLTFW